MLDLDRDKDQISFSGCKLLVMRSLKSNHSVLESKNSLLIHKILSLGNARNSWSQNGPKKLHQPPTPVSYEEVSVFSRCSLKATVVR